MFITQKHWKKLLSFRIPSLYFSLNFDTPRPCTITFKAFESNAKNNSFIMKKMILPLTLILTFSLACQAPNYTNGMVVSAQPIASEVGIDILKKGGNAMDAAVAVQFALSVTLPIAGNIGGGGFLVYRSAEGDYDALDYREKAPENAFRDMYLDEHGNPIEGLSLYGGLASGVPGTVDGMVMAHQKYGRLSWAELLEPAVKLGENGFPLSAAQAAGLNSNRNNFLQWNPEGCAFTSHPEWKEGDMLVQSELAQTLKRIQKQGRRGFYEGETADYIVEEMKNSGGIITHQDLEDYRSVWRTPVTGMYKNYKIISMPPPSSGGIALVTLLHSVEDYPLSNWGFEDERTVQLMVEAERRAYADRAEFLGDPDFVSIPTEVLTSKANAAERMETFSFERATPSSEVGPSKIEVFESIETTHYSIVDSDGNAVSVTTTLNGAYGSFVTVRGAGFLLNNEMDDFSLKPGAPNLYGLTGGDANAVEPGKRMLSSMTPTIVEKDDKLFMVIGTPGGSTIITSVFQSFLNVAEFGMDMQQAVSVPRFHHQWLPDEVFVEKDAISTHVRKNLTEKGYNFVGKSPWGWTDGTWGRVDAILIKEDGSYEGGADPRGDDHISAY